MGTEGAMRKGKRNKHVHGKCRRCGKGAFHLSRGICAACGFGRSKKIRRYGWMKLRKK